MIGAYMILVLLVVCFAAFVWRQRVTAARYRDELAAERLIRMVGRAAKDGEQ